MTLAKYPLLLLFAYSTIVAQQMSHPVMLSRDDAFSTPRPYVALPETLDILAVMVQFQIDTDARTSGNGRFDLGTTSGPILDAPPRNPQYFQDHLTFVENYYSKASKGKLVVRSTVVSQVITLAGTIESYSPPRNGPNTRVGNLAVDSWHTVDSLGLVADFSLYECFVVFHAGVGRDIDLVSILGYDPTPFDIPSLYLGLNAFRSFYGAAYDGIPVNNGTHRITNSLVIPETSSRLLPGLTGDVLLELSINGLLCASVGNHLGLPDLFDTNTGRSGIGRFGLMDGQAIFSFAGTFPPEPSAWEKYWLGWIEPITLEAGEHAITLPAVGISDTVYRVPISAQEYYLIENRNRDPLRNGQTITSVYNGATVTQTFGKDTSGFNATDLEALAGVITNVEDLDWSVPGGVTSSGEFFDGGALIWHIDEAVIAEGLSGNGVNSNPLRRGVDVEEADGSQDIGQEYGFLTPGSGSEEGTPLDFWYEGNSAPVYRNEFSQTSYPNNMSNSGGNSHITVRAFGARAARMAAVIQVGTPTTAPLPGFPKSVGRRLTVPSLIVDDWENDGVAEIIIATTDTASSAPVLPGSPAGGSTFSSIYAWKTDGAPALAGGPASGLFASVPLPGFSFTSSPLVRDITGDGINEVIAVGNRDPIGYLHAYTPTRIPPDSLALLAFDETLGGARLTCVAISDSLIVVGTNEGRANIHRLDGTLIGIVFVALDTTVIVQGISRFSGSNTFIITASNGRIYRTALLLGGGGTGTIDFTVNVGRSIAGPAAYGVFDPVNSDHRIVFTTTDGWLYALTADLDIVSGFPVDIGDGISSTVALADFDNDGYRDILVFGRNRIHAINHAGASLDYFPILVPSSNPITSSPVVADLDGDGNVEVIAVTHDGLVVAYDKIGRMAQGFPLQGGTGSHSAAIFDIPTPSLSRVDIGLAVASTETGSISAWKTGSTSFPYNSSRVRPWPQYQKDAQHSGLALEPLTGSPLSNNFFPENRAYNWPNPVYDGKTFIRYFVKDNASVSIKVFNLAGDLVTEFAGPGVGGVDNEVEWNVKDVQSGVYFARIEASGGGGSGVAIVKVAIVK